MGWGEAGRGLGTVGGGYGCIVQAPIVQRVDNAIQRINCYPAVKCWQNILRYPLDSDLSRGKCYPTSEQPGPGVKMLTFEL